MHDTTELTGSLLELAELLRQAADRAETIASEVATHLAAPARDDGDVGLIIDQRLLAVRWNGGVCHLGNTIPFRLMERFARRPNQYLSHERLLREIWGGARSRSAIRSAVRELRLRLIEAGMPELAQAIDGRTPGQYGFFPDR